MLKSSIAAFCVLAFAALPALADDPIVGRWMSPKGRIVEVVDCGGRYCATVITGKYKGRSVGTLTGSDGDYSGTVTDPRNRRTYSGTATLEGSRLTVEGCALKVICKTQRWTRA